MLKRATQALIAAAVIAVSAAGSASANNGKPADPDQSACVAVVSNGGIQAEFIHGVQSEGPGAVGDLSREFGRSGGNGPFVPHGCF
jgi:hypothetical protein